MLTCDAIIIGSDTVLIRRLFLALLRLFLYTGFREIRRSGHRLFPDCCVPDDYLGNLQLTRLSVQLERIAFEATSMESVIELQNL